MQPDAPVLHWYVFREGSGVFRTLAERCSRQAGDRYRLEISALPVEADQQRTQLARRLAARDPDIDVLAMDVIWVPEFAEAGWVLDWGGPEADRIRARSLPSAVESSTWQGTLHALPFTSNAQLLWYRTDLVEEPPRTWDRMIEEAEALADAGKPHRIQVQGARYEGLAVWFNSLLASAGGSVIATETGSVNLPEEETKGAFRIMRRLATSVTAPSNLATATEDDGRLAFEAGTSAFMVNYTYVWPSARENAPEIADAMGWARYPRVDPDRPSRVTVGGLNLGVGAYTRHPELAREAARCLRSREHQLLAAERGGLPPTLEALYAHPRIREAFPFAGTLRETLRAASVRPQTPAYSDVSLAIQRTLHPVRSIRPERDLETLRARIDDALQSRGLL